MYWCTETQPRQIVTPHLHLRCRRCTSAVTPHMQSPTAGPGSLRSGPGSARRRPAAAGRRHQWRSGAQPRQIALPHLHLRCRRRTRAHTKPNARSCLTRSGPSSARRSPSCRRRRSPSNPPKLSTGGRVGSQNFSADASPWPIDRGSSNDAEQFSFRVRTNSIRNQPRVRFGPP